MLFHVLADSDWTTPDPAPDGWRWTYRTDVHLAGSDSRVAVSQSAPKENHAAVLSLDEALSPTWRGHLGDSGGAWLEPWLLRLRSTAVAGRDLVHRDLLAAFAQRRGRPPTTYEWDLA